MMGTVCCIDLQWPPSEGKEVVPGRDGVVGGHEG